MLITQLHLKKPLITLLITIGLSAASIFITGCSNDGTNTPSSITTTGVDGATSVDGGRLATVLDTLPIETLSTAETDGLIYMREEERLAHDVYVILFGFWQTNIFNNISSSEQTHTDAVLALLDRYVIADPVGNNAAGVFTNTTLQNLYDTLIAQGSASLIDGLIVGAIIEEVDIIDIQAQLDNVVDNQDIIVIYENLLKGSRNHLRAFVNNLQQQNFSYTPQHISQQLYDEIINSAMETN